MRPQLRLWALLCRQERKRRRAEERLALKAAKEAEERRQRQIAALGANLGLSDGPAPSSGPGESRGPCPDGARCACSTGPVTNMAPWMSQLPVPYMPANARAERSSGKAWTRTSMRLTQA